MRKVTPMRMITVGELREHLATFRDDDPVFIETSMAIGYDGNPGECEHDDLGLHRVVGFYGADDTPAQRDGPVIQCHHNVHISAVGWGNAALVETTDD